MKKNLIYALLSATALTVLLGFSACSSNDEVTAAPSPYYDPSTNSVKANFVLNLSSAEQGTTRQSAAAVQKNNNFRGMQNAMLVGLSTGKSYDTDHPTYWLAPFAGEASGYSVYKTYDLGTLYATTAVNNAGTSNQDNSSHRVVELTLPVNTDAMLVYGRAIPSDDVMENGKVTMPTSYAAPSSIKFELVPRLGDNVEAYTQICNYIALVLNRVMLSEVEASGIASPITKNGYTQQAALPALSWREIGSKTAGQIAALAPLQENLATVYKTIADTYSTADIHCGSASAVCNMIKDVYSIANSVDNATATNDDELNAQLLANVIKTRISYYFDISSDPYTIKELGQNQSGDPMKYLIDNTALTAGDFTGTGSYAKAKTNENKIPTFPQSFELPEGVAQLKFTAFESDGTNGFAYLTLDNSHSLIDIANTLNPAKYTYPAELLYFDNSLLRVTDADKTPTAYPNGYYDWDTNAWTGWTIGKVASTTRSVAVKNNINYGVAMLQTKVTIDNTVTDFLDNHPAADNFKMTAAEIGAFTLTGVLIGSQYKQVGWNYLSTGDGTNKDFVIFDNKVVSGTVPTPANYENYTLVFDNYASGTQSDVLVALEFKNGNDKDIYGKGGMIPKGGTFYLVGKLQLASPATGSTITWPTTYAIPPYNANGESTQTTRVFIQDYMTTATFKIGANSLKNAFTTIPDLRSSQTSLGLSVDLQWRPGLSFETVLGQ